MGTQCAFWQGADDVTHVIVLRCLELGSDLNLTDDGYGSLRNS